MLLTKALQFLSCSLCSDEGIAEANRQSIDWKIAEQPQSHWLRVYQDGRAVNEGRKRHLFVTSRDMRRIASHIMNHRFLRNFTWQLYLPLRCFQQYRWNELAENSIFPHFVISEMSSPGFEHTTYYTIAIWNLLASYFN